MTRLADLAAIVAWCAIVAVLLPPYALAELARRARR